MHRELPISVIITAYNEERFVGRCLRSITRQSFPSQDYEVIVVNDASTDRTAYALDLFGDSIKVLTNSDNKGLPASLNRAIQASTAKYIVRLDADDYVNINYLNFLYMFLENNLEYDAVCCDYIKVDDSEKVLDRCCALSEPIGCGIMFRREHLLDLGLYDETFCVHEDKDMQARFKQLYTLGHLKLPLYRYRMHENNITNNTALLSHHEQRFKEKHKLK